MIQEKRFENFENDLQECNQLAFVILKKLDSEGA